MFLPERDSGWPIPRQRFVHCNGFKTSLAPAPLLEGRRNLGVIETAYVPVGERNSELVSARTELPEQFEFASGHSVQW